MGACSVYKTINGYDIASFDISQTDASELITVIGIFFHYTGKPYLDKTNCSKLKISSVIQFIQSAPMQLQGYKRLSYLL